MQTSLYVGISAQQMLLRRIDSIAHNVANSNTPGFRADGMRFSTLLEQAGDKQIAYASNGEEVISRQSGPIERSGNALDVAIQGDGWLGLMSPGGIIYTRDGRLSMSEDGQLRSVNGYAVLDAGGAPITLDATAGTPTIAADGMISQNGKQLGAIGLFRIDAATHIVRADNSGVTTDSPAEPVLDFSRNGLVQGFTEGSNVNSVMEMSHLIDIQRLFEGVTNAMETTESNFSDAVKTLGSSTN